MKPTCESLIIETVATASKENPVFIGQLISSIDYSDDVIITTIKQMMHNQILDYEKMEIDGAFEAKIFGLL